MCSQFVAGHVRVGHGLAVGALVLVAYAFEVFGAGSAWVSYGSAFALPPSGRNLHVLATDGPRAALADWSAALTCIAHNDPKLGAALGSAFPGARVVPLGAMQRPALDGPVDRRKSPAGERL